MGAYGDGLPFGASLKWPLDEQFSLNPLELHLSAPRAAAWFKPAQHPHRSYPNIGRFGTS